MKYKLETVLIIIGMIFLLVLGWCGNNLYRIYENKRNYNGLFISDRNRTETMKTADSYDSIGNWVCINVKGMTFGEARETCNHECMHSAYSEIISEKCEDNFIECEELINNYIK